MKRKDVNDYFSNDFTFSSPALKIRRLDAELAPIMEDEEVINHRSSGYVNEERAIVLYNPILNSSSYSPNFTVSLDSDIISRFNNQFPWRNQCDRIKLLEEEDETDNETKECRAVVPWVSSPFPTTLCSDVSPSNAPEQMEADEMGEAAMEVEEDNEIVPEQGNVFEYGRIRESDGLPQWQQQHCLIPELPQNNATPIAWFR